MGQGVKDLLRLLRPDEIRPAVQDVDLERLWDRGIRALIVDLDNTLAEVDSLRVSPPIAAWVRRARDRGFRLCIASNSLPRRVRAFEEQLGVPALASAVKPRRRAFRRALARINARPRETAVIGDQLFTDVLGGNRMGMYTILINPLSRVELSHTRMIRHLERRVMAALRRREWISQEDWRIRCGGGTF